MGTPVIFMCSKNLVVEWYDHPVRAHLSLEVPRAKDILSSVRPCRLPSRIGKPVG